MGSTVDLCTFLGQQVECINESNRPEELRVVGESCIAYNAVIAGCKSDTSWRWDDHDKNICASMRMRISGHTVDGRNPANHLGCIPCK